MTTHADPADERLAARLTDYLDGQLDDAAAAELDALLGDDALREALDQARGGRDLLGGLQRPAVPRDFLRKVQRRVRRRSGGRYFHPAVQPFGWRMSVEVFVVIAVAVMAGCWFIMGVGRVPQPIVDENPAGVEVPAEPLQPTGGATLAPILPKPSEAKPDPAPAEATPAPAPDAPAAP